MKQFPTLYQKTKTGAIQFWTIKVDEANLGFTLYPEIETTYGQLGTDSPQVAREFIKEGKNLGKKNETSPMQQAETEAEALWTRQKKKGYVESPSEALAGRVDASVILGGREPMLAHKYMEVIYDLREGHEGEVHYEITPHAKKIKFPARCQPKLDGIRCESEIDGTMWSRTRKQFHSCPHLEKEIQLAFRNSGLMLDSLADGELYNHSFKKDFEKITSAVSSKTPKEGHELVEYHVYDISGPGTFAERTKLLESILGNGLKEAPHIKRVETVLVNSHEELIAAFERFVRMGFEGAIVRNADGLYMEDRSYDLQKLKPFIDDEFLIVGFEEGDGKLAGKLGKWICKTKDGITFDPPMNASLPKLQEYFEHGDEYVGKLLTVRFQGYTGTNNVPRFPKGHSVRDYE